MAIEYFLLLPIALILLLFTVYLCGRMFGLGLLASLKLRTTKETKCGTRQ